MNTRDDNSAINDFLASWSDTATQTRKTFLELKDHLTAKPETVFDFLPRPGVSYSLRFKHRDQSLRPMFAMIDIIDDDPENRWLSVCFYNDMITDPDEKGDYVPEGLLGEDACCFDIEDRDESLNRYVCDRLDEAMANASLPK